MIQVERRVSDILQLLDEHHVVLLADEPEMRETMSRALIMHLRDLTDARVIAIRGEDGHRIDGISHALRKRLDPEGDIEADGLAAVIQMLRRRGGAERHRYIIWEHAEEMLERDVAMFGKVVNAFMAVAAEHEYFNPEVLVLQRIIFMGGAKLGAYSEEENGQFCKWLAPGASAPFEDVTESVPRPAVLTYRLDG